MTSSNQEVVSSKESKGWGITEFFLGLILIPLSIVCIWKNEKKIVNYNKVIVKAKDSLKSVAADKIDDKNDFELVHVSGKSQNDSLIEDKAFGVKAPNSYRVIRTVEMYQTKEIVKETRRDNDTVVKDYTYESGWFSHPIDSSGFYVADRRDDNPKHAWPFKSDRFEAVAVHLGEFQLTKS